MINKKDKKITNAELLESINRSFSKIEEKMATKEELKNLEVRMATKKDLKTQEDVLQIILKEIKAIHENSKSFRD